MKRKTFNWAGEKWDSDGAQNIEALELQRIVTEESDLVEAKFCAVITHVLKEHPHLEILRFKEQSIRSFVERAQKKARVAQAKRTTQHREPSAPNASSRTATFTQFDWDACYDAVEELHELGGGERKALRRRVRKNDSELRMVYARFSRSGRRDNFIRDVREILEDD